MRRYLAIVLGAGVGVLIGIVGLVVLSSQSPSVPAVDPVAQSVCANLSAQNYGATYQELSPNLQREGTEAQFAAAQKELDALNGPVTSCAASVQHADAANATVSLRLARARSGGSTTSTLHLALIGGAWKVVDYDASVF